MEEGAAAVSLRTSGVRYLVIFTVEEKLAEFFGFSGSNMRVPTVKYYVVTFDNTANDLVVVGNNGERLSDVIEEMRKSHMHIKDMRVQSLDDPTHLERKILAEVHDLFAGALSLYAHIQRDGEERGAVALEE